VSDTLSLPQITAQLLRIRRDLDTIQSQWRREWESGTADWSLVTGADLIVDTDDHLEKALQLLGRAWLLTQAVDQAVD